MGDAAAPRPRRWQHSTSRRPLIHRPGCRLSSGRGKAPWWHASCSSKGLLACRRASRARAQRGAAMGSAGAPPSLIRASGKLSNFAAGHNPNRRPDALFLISPPPAPFLRNFPGPSRVLKNVVGKRCTRRANRVPAQRGADETRLARRPPFKIPGAPPSPPYLHRARARRGPLHSSRLGDYVAVPPTSRSFARALHLRPRRATMARPCRIERPLW